MKLTSPGKDHMEAHYADLKDKKFFPGLIEYMTSGPVCAMVWEGKNVVKEGRKMLGATMPGDSACGTIRGDFWYVYTQIIHGYFGFFFFLSSCTLYPPDAKQPRYTCILRILFTTQC